MIRNDFKDAEMAVYDDDDAPAEAPGRDVQMPLATGILGEEGAIDPLAGATRAKKISGGTILIVIVVVIAAGGLVAMRQLLKITSVHSLGSEAESMVEQFLSARKSQTASPVAASSGAEVSADSTIIEVLSEAYTEHQVPLRDVQKNPFILLAVGSADSMPDATINPDAAISEFHRRRDQRRAEFEAFAAQLRLKSIMAGETPLALIENRIVRVGDEIAVSVDGPKMKIEEITGTDVLLVGRAPEFDLVVRARLEVTRDPSPQPKFSGAGEGRIRK